MASTQTEMRSPQHRSTAPPSPTSHKKVGFFKRHLGQRRRSSVHFPNGQPVSPQAHAHSPHQPTSAMRKSSVSSSVHELDRPGTSGTDRTDMTDATDVTDKTDDSHEISETSATNGTSIPSEASQSVEEPQEQDSMQKSGSKPSGIKWAPGYGDGRPTRPRRTSSSGTRRSSIYVKGPEGSYAEGVDAGVGSKARRLSVLIPDHLEVDECALADHFSVFARAGKKDIGEGGAAVVRLMQSKTAGNGNQRVFAVKEFREWDSMEEDKWDYERKIKSEYAIAKSLLHPNIVETYRLCHSDKKWFHVMEYCDLGDLNDIIKQGYFSREDKDCMFKQLLRGVEYIHARGIAHRDLKSENLLLSKSGCLKIADFGTAEVFSGTHPGLRNCRRQSLIPEEAEIRLCKPGMVGSKPYMAPEILKHEEDYDPRAVDVWSTAIVYLTLCIGGTPWDAASTQTKNYNIYCSTWDEWLAKYPDGVLKEGRSLPGFAATKQFQALGDPVTKRMVLAMLHPDPSMRWSAKEALDTQLVTEMPCCQQEGYSDDIKTRQRKALHNHVPPKSPKSSKLFKS